MIELNQISPDSLYEGGVRAKISSSEPVDLIQISKQSTQNALNPVKITFDNLMFEVEIKKQNQTSRQKIIKDVSGYAMPGQTLYIMGASGAGKTSLLNILSDRIAVRSQDKLEGKITINDTMQVDNENFGKVSGYVMQDDILYQHFTPREALKFAADLKLGHLNEAQKWERVDELIDQLGLKGASNTIIGSQLNKTISGGERKRTAIGVELITNPSLILLDEPTSGLDSFKAFQIVKLLKSLARKGKTIISTIHQPSSESFLEFDRLLLMSDGNCVYQGAANLSARYFRKIGFYLPNFSNPADTYMRILAVNYPKSQKDDRKIEFFVKNYNQRMKARIEEENKQISLPEPNLKTTETFQPGVLGQMFLLMKRNRLGLQRDPLQSKAKVGQQVIFALIVGAIFHNLGFHNDNDLYENTEIDVDDPESVKQVKKQYASMQIFGSFFFISTNSFMANLQNSILVFQQERPVFLREQANKMYGVFPYYFAKVTMDTPVLLLAPAISTVIMYNLLNLQRTWEQFFKFYLSILGVAFCASSIGQFISSFFEQEAAALSLAPLMIMPMILFGGMFANNEELPEFLSYIQYISPIKYTAEALMWNEFSEDKYDLRDGIMEFIGYKLSYWKCILVFCGLFVLFRIITFISFKLLVRKFQ